MDVLTIFATIAVLVAGYLCLRMIDGFFQRLGALLADKWVRRFRRSSDGGEEA